MGCKTPLESRFFNDSTKSLEKSQGFLFLLLKYFYPFSPYFNVYQKGSPVLL